MNAPVRPQSDMNDVIVNCRELSSLTLSVVVSNLLRFIRFSGIFFSHTQSYNHNKLVIIECQEEVQNHCEQ